MTTFTATADAQGRFITLTVSAVTADSVLTITRDPSPGDITVRGTPVEIPAGGATVLTDVEFPFGVTVTYTAVLRDPTTGDTLETLTDTAGPISLAQDGMVVSDPFTNRQVVLTVIDQRDERSEFRGTRMEVAGRPDPLYVLDAHAGWRWVNEWLTTDPADRAQLDGLLRTGHSVLLRVSSGCDLRDGWVAVENINVARAGRPSSITRRRWNVEVGAIEAPPSTVETAAVTLQDLADWEPGTLQDLADRTPATLLDLALTVIADS